MPDSRPARPSVAPSITEADPTSRMGETEMGGARPTAAAAAPLPRQATAETAIISAAPGGSPHGAGPLSWTTFLLLSWTAVGVIFGDIGTSPLYVYISIFQELGVDQPDKADVLGAASLIFWTLTLEVLVKYCFVVLRADDQGQGGTFAIYSLLCRHIGIKPQGAPRGPPTARSAAAKAAKKAAAKPPRGGRDDGDSDSDSGDEAEARARGPRAWWQRCGVDAEAVRAFFRRSPRVQVALWGVAVVATANLVGDGVLTPSISVLSAVSGLTVAVPDLKQDAIIGITIAILFVVFAMQPLGTGKVGRIYAPVVALWLLANLAINLNTIAKYGGGVFQAISPAHIVTYFRRHGAAGWRSLGAVMLSVTGVEALYADLGHLTRGSITAASVFLAYPCLAITYFGQAAWMIEHPADVDVFWKSMPRSVLYPMLVLATLATMIASQALISAIFSTMRQATILGAMPPLKVVHTGGNDLAAARQIYLPLVNAVLFVLCVAVVGGFQSTVTLGKAYGLAVMTTMLTTTCLIVLVMLVVWELGLPLILLFALPFLAIEGVYWSANIIKVVEGGWFTIAVAGSVAVLMLTWWAGSRRLGVRLAAATAGARLRLLGAPAPRLPPVLPPLPEQPLPPPPPSRQLRSASARGAFSGGQPASYLLARMSTWALRRRTSGHGGGAAASTDAAAAAASDAGGAAVLAPGAAASSAPLPGMDRQTLRRQWSARAAAERAQARERAVAAASLPRLSAVELSALPTDTLVLELPDPLTFLLGVEAAEAEEGDLEAAGAAAPPKPLLVPLQRLRGVGVYYMDEKVGDIDAAAPSLPPVLVHFLRNVQAIHGVCVFLSVRRLPLPSVPRRRRLHVYTSRNATAPNFYHVVSSYGYLDAIDHGPAFLTELLDAVLRRLKAVAAARRRQAAGGGGDGGGGGDAGGGDGGGDGGAYTARAESHHGDDQPPRDMRDGELVVRSLSHGAASSGGVGADSKGKSSVASGGGDGGGAPALGGAGEGVDGLLAAVEAAAADFLEAQLHGVVYYASRAVLRDRAARPRGSSLSRPHPAPGPLASAWAAAASTAHWLLFGVLYRWLAAVAFVDMESWRVPPERLVELGMAVEM